MQVGDLVRYTGLGRIGMKTGAIGYIKSKHIGKNTLVLCMVTILTTGKEIGILERSLDVYGPRNQTKSR
jgi:non-canonical (house-cleaning) NTP pyrophosphatase